ncbi:MAG TPA: hypothetical protein DIW07_04980 [Lachnospiraceae bacterium]|jgi:hypothetical protein|uniref:hypothetical protein n=1 Tax=Catenisphaera adipataccumulans TaxID=700500 RepID=UPI000EEE8D6C|nr:hypothetical protein [Lachnospiraceae bacterium]
MAKSRRANAVLFGFDFQVNAAIVLMLENVQELESLRLEGEEDIELKLEDGTEVLAQAKAVEKASSDFRNVRANLKKALASLSDGARECNAKELILITNSPNPLNDDNTRSIFFGDAHRTFESLPESAKALINSYLAEVEAPLDTNKFKIQILPFETDDDLERYKVVYSAVDRFVGSLRLNISGLGSEILKIWQSDVFRNGTRKKEEIRLNKKDIIWPILVVATDVERYDEQFMEVFDDALYDEIIAQYKDVINSCCERYEFFAKVLSDYQSFEFNGSRNDKCKQFAFSQWEHYSEEFPLVNADYETKKGLIQVILYQIVRNRLKINRIKQEVRL